MKIYIPIEVFNRDDIKALYTSLGPKIVKDISVQLDRYFDLCQTIDISKEFKHNKYIQQKYFNSKLDKGSAPLYVSKTNRVHISKLHNGAKHLKLLEIYTNSATTPEQITAAFQLICVSFWPDFTAHNILSWIDKNYNLLFDANMRITRIPFISNINIYSSLLSLGKVTANTDDTFIYCIWEGNAAELQRDLTTVKRRVGQEIEIKDKNIEEFNKSVEKQLSMIKTHLNDQKPTMPFNNVQKTVSISEKPLTVTVNKQPEYTPENIIAKLGRKEAAALAQAILNKLLD